MASMASAGGAVVVMVVVVVVVVVVGVAASTCTAAWERRGRPIASLAVSERSRLEAACNRVACSLWPLCVCSERPGCLGSLASFSCCKNGK